MKFTFLKTGLILFLLVFFLFPITTHAAIDEAEFIVQDLSVEDVKYDDGTGLKLTWEPLPKEKRIIEYRIYRGVTADTLFYIGRIDVNVKTGVSSATMSYFDKDWNFFADLTSPSKLKREKGQSKDGVLFQGIPRDINVLGPELENYTILSVISEKDFYYKKKQVEHIVENDTTVTDTAIYSGLKLRNFSTLLKKLIPQKEYFYTVVAVNEARRYFSHAKIVSGKAFNDAPEPPKKLYPVFVEDLKQLNFEWANPQKSSDLAYFCIYKLRKKDLSKFQKAVENGEDENPAELLLVKNTTIPNSDTENYAIIDIANGMIFDEGFGIDTKINANELDDYYFLYSFVDYHNQETYSDVFEVEHCNSDVLPIIPAFKVVDRIDDKGDYNTIFWGDPAVKLVGSTYQNQTKTKLLVAYETYTNSSKKLKNIHFEVSDENGEIIQTINEFFIDNKILVEIPENLKKINFKIILEGYENYEIQQQLVYNETTKSLKPATAFVNDGDLEKFSYAVYKKNYLDDEFEITKKLSGLQREYDDKIKYEKDHYKVPKIFDADKKLIYVAPSFETYDFEGDSSLVVNLFKLNKKEVKRYDKARHFAKRSYQYKMVVTDGEGHFVESLVYENEGVKYFFPKPNWVKRTMLPALIAGLIFGLLVFMLILKAKTGHDFYVRPIAGIEEIDNAIGRATEMGKPILFVPGFTGISDVATLASLAILGRVAKKAAEYDTKILVPIGVPLVLPIAQEVVKEAHYEAGRPDTYDKNSVFFITTSQFAYVAGINGIMIREKVATNFFMGMFFAEALIMAETGAATGAIQIAGTDAITQLPFFITTCDYTLIGEELYAASAYLARNPLQMGTLKAVDYFKLIIIISVVAGTLLSTLHLTFFINALPEK